MEKSVYWEDEQNGQTVHVDPTTLLRPFMQIVLLLMGEPALPKAVVNFAMWDFWNSYPKLKRKRFPRRRKPLSRRQFLDLCMDWFCQEGIYEFVVPERFALFRELVEERRIAGATRAQAPGNNK